MYIKKNSRRALLLSVMSLILCCAMLVGTTFAWFTDEVKSGRNIIAAGNLDVELYNDGSKVTGDTKLFDDVDPLLWEPGAVAFENLQVVNEGSLALKYNLDLTVLEETEVNGHKLSEVIMVGTSKTPIDKNSGREAVVNSITNWVPLNQFKLIQTAQKLEAGKNGNTNAAEEIGIVLYWAPNSNEIDNLYNMNNENKGKTLQLEIGVVLHATQVPQESDSFGPDYDGEAFTPVADVTPTGAKTVNLVGGGTMNLDTSFRFKTTEDQMAAAASGYRYWHADFVVSADKLVKANSLALAGYYQAYADFTNTQDQWIALESDTDIAAGTPIRLLKEALAQVLGSGVSGNYEELCQFIPEFLCGATDKDGSNEGTTLTVELRLYETYPEGQCPEDHDGHKSKNCETGKFVTIGRYTHTFGGEWEVMEDGTELFKDNEGGVTLYDTQSVNAVNYVVPDGVTHLGNYSMSYNKTIENVTLPSSVEDLGRAFDSNTTIKNVELNEGLETISSRAFKATSALESVKISSTVKTIAADAFQKTGLKEIVIPATVEYVGETAFGASKIEKVTFEGNTRIENKAFRSCKNLEEVYINGEDITFVNTAGQGNCWFCNSESNNTGVSNITFYVKNEAVASKVWDAMGYEMKPGGTVEILVNGNLYTK